MTTATARVTSSYGCSPVMTLRLLAMADDDAVPTILDEPEQLLLPLEWVRAVPRQAAPLPAASTDRPDPRQWGGRVTLAAFEVMLGNRPATQLARVVDPKTLHTLSLHTNRLSIERKRLRNVVAGRPRLASVRCYQPHPAAAEITAVVYDGIRMRAVALRLTARGGQWVTTAFEMG